MGPRTTGRRPGQGERRWPPFRGVGGSHGRPRTRRREQGVGQTRGIDAVTAILGVLLSGAACCPLDPGAPDTRTAALLADAEPALVLTTGAQAARFADRAVLLLDAPDTAVRSPVAAAATMGDPAYVIHTSGSTGRPKGVEICPTEATVVAAVAAPHDPALSPGDVPIGVALPGMRAVVLGEHLYLVGDAPAPGYRGGRPRTRRGSPRERPGRQRHRLPAGRPRPGVPLPGPLRQDRDAARPQRGADSREPGRTSPRLLKRSPPYPPRRPMLTKRPVAVGLAGVLCLATAACGASSSPTTQTAAGTPAAGYPVTIENCGQSTTYTRAPSRVVVMNGASVAEVSALLALGLGDRIVVNGQSYGMSEVAGRAKAIKALPTGGIKLNDAYDIPREAMLGLRPDLVLSTTSYGFDAKNGFATREDLKAVDARTYVSPQGCDQDTSRMTVEDSYTLLRDLGKIFHVGDRAEKLIAASKKRIGAISAGVRGEKTPGVMVVFSNMAMGGNDFSSIAANGIWNDVLAKAGGRNAFASASTASFADLSKEKVAAEPVDALVVISYNDPNPAAYARTLLKEFPQWPAAKNDRYTVLSDSIYLGPSNDLAVDKIARMLHPDAF